ncbi:hypothetical protein MATL_G00106750, partial [Megalops atlanticus]
MDWVFERGLILAVVAPRPPLSFSSPRWMVCASRKSRERVRVCMEALCCSSLSCRRCSCSCWRLSSSAIFLDSWMASEVCCWSYSSCSCRRFSSSMATSSVRWAARACRRKDWMFSICCSSGSWTSLVCSTLEEGSQPPALVIVGLGGWLVSPLVLASERDFSISDLLFCASSAAC